MAKAVGLLEVYGLSTALYAIDAACKAADVTVDAIEKNRPPSGPNIPEYPVPLLLMLKFRGKVDDVRIAVDVAIKAADEIAGHGYSSVISNPDDGLEDLLDITCI